MRLTSGRSQRSEPSGVDAGRTRPLARAIGLHLLGWSALCIAGFPLFAHADDSAADAANTSNKKVLTLDAVTVTVEKRATNLQKTPAAVSAIDAGQLQEREVHTLKDLAGQSAGLTLPSNYLNQQYVFIRGIGSSRPAGNPSVGIYIDDVYMPRQFANSFLNLPDIDQVEVLRGPQGTLYGQNTSSGAIKVSTRVPDNTTVASVSVQGGNRSTLDSQAYLAGALVPDVLTASFSLTRRRNAGYTYDETLDRHVNSFDTTQGRAKFVLTPGDGLRAILSIDDAIDHSTNAIPTPISLNGKRVTGVNKNQTQAPITGRTHLKTGGISLVISKDFDSHLTLKSITAARNIKDNQPWDDTGLATPYYSFFQTIHQRQFSQEFQFLGNYDDWNFVAGASFMREHFGIDRLTDFSNNWSIQQSYNTANTAGIFGQVRYAITDALGVTAGIRFAHELHELTADAYTSNAHRDFLTRSFIVNGLGITSKSYTPKVTLDYTWSPALYSYATWAKGETSGGWNPAPATLAIALIPVKPEKVTSYELGLKSSFWNGRAQANAAVFYNKYDDFQTNLSNPVINGQTILGTVLANADRAHTEGAELETTFKLTRSFLLKANAAYLKTRVDQYLTPSTLTKVDYTGNVLPYAPRQSYSINGIYDWELPRGNLRFNGTVRYATGYYTGVENLYRAPSQTYVDAGLFYTTESGQWTLSLTGKNLTNRLYATPAAIASALSAAYNTPREWLLGVRYDLL